MERRGVVETTVGIFVLIGLLITAILIIQLGKIGQSIKGAYEFYVEFPDAGGLIKGGQVRYTGVLVGRLSDEPKIIPGDKPSVRIKVRVFDEVKIRKNAKVTIGQLGFLGDSVLNVDPVANTPASVEYIKEGDVMLGTKKKGLSELAEDGSELIAQLKVTVKKLDNIAGKVDQALNKEAIANVQASLRSIKTTFSNMSAVTEDLKEGRGTVGKLLHDEETGENIKAFIHNIRSNGVLFYKNSYDKDLKKKEDKDKNETKPGENRTKEMVDPEGIGTKTR
ncbi:MAG: MlaD family protein [Verrucomicrobiota bacterium]|nr:MlaD family protein [Verrucomicrobiota bacterium]